MIDRRHRGAGAAGEGGAAADPELHQPAHARRRRAARHAHAGRRRGPSRFKLADQQLLAVVAGQIVVAIQNARLHDSVRRGKREWERTFDAINDPIAVFDSRGELLRGNTALAAHLGRPVTQLRPASCRDVGFCGGGCPALRGGPRRSRRTARREEITLPDGQIFSVTTFPMLTGPEGRLRRAGRQERDRGDPQRPAAAPDERRAGRRQRAAHRGGRSVEVHAGAAAAGGEALGHRAARRRRRPRAEQSADERHRVRAAAPGRDARSARAAELRRARISARDLRRIAEESERAARIVRNLLAFARRQTAAREPQDLTDLCARVVALRSYELRLTGVELITDFQPGLPQVDCRRRPDPAGAAQPGAQRGTGDARPAGPAADRRRTARRAPPARSSSSCRTPVMASMRRTSRGSSTRSSRRATSAKAPASA